MSDKKINVTFDGTTASWELRAEGPLNGTYTGKFKFRCFLTPTQRIAANREYRELLGSNPTLVPEHESFLAYALTQLKYRIIEAPPFWTSTSQSSPYAGDIADENIITEVLNAAVEAEVQYQKQIKQRTLEALERAKKAAEKILNQPDEDEDEDQEASD